MMHSELKYLFILKSKYICLNNELKDVSKLKLTNLIEGTVIWVSSNTKSIDIFAAATWVIEIEMYTLLM
jgi:hypothetical protein